MPLQRRGPHGLTQHEHIRYFQDRVAPIIEELTLDMAVKQPDVLAPSMIKWFLDNANLTMPSAGLDAKERLAEEASTLQADIAALEAQIAAKEAAEKSAAAASTHKEIVAEAVVAEEAMAAEKAQTEEGGNTAEDVPPPLVEGCGKPLEMVDGIEGEGEVAEGGKAVREAPEPPVEESGGGEEQAAEAGGGKAVPVEDNTDGNDNRKKFVQSATYTMNSFEEEDSGPEEDLEAEEDIVEDKADPDENEPVVLVSDPLVLPTEQEGALPAESGVLDAMEGCAFPEAPRSYLVNMMPEDGAEE